MSVCLHVRMLITSESCAYACQNRESDLLKLDLEMVVSHHVGSGNINMVFCKRNRCSKPLSYLSYLGCRAQSVGETVRI